MDSLPEGSNNEAMDSVDSLDREDGFHLGELVFRISLEVTPSKKSSTFPS